MAREFDRYCFPNLGRLQGPNGTHEHRGMHEIFCGRAVVEIGLQSTGSLCVHPVTTPGNSVPLVKIQGRP
jgi:hypothetical protein